MSFNIGPNIAEFRKSLGLTQVQLAVRSKISLPTLQNLESGKANPSWLILERLSLVLGFELRFAPAKPDWSLLCALGLPLIDESAQKIRRPKQMLPELQRTVALYLQSPTSFELRQAEALLGFMGALRDHYPSVLMKHFPHLKRHVLAAAIAEIDTGRWIKMRRLSLARMQVKCLL